MSDNDSRFDDKLPATPPPTGLRASNTVESLKPRDITGYQTPSGENISLEQILAPGKALDKALDVFLKHSEPLTGDLANEISSCVTPGPPSPEEVTRWEKHLAENPLPGATFVRKTDLFTKPEQPEKLNANVLPVNFPASTGLGGKKFEMPSMHDRVTKLEDQVDALLDRIAKHNLRAQHRI